MKERPINPFQTALELKSKFLKPEEAILDTLLHSTEPIPGIVHRERIDLAGVEPELVTRIYVSHFVNYAQTVGAALTSSGFSDMGDTLVTHTNTAPSGSYELFERRKPLNNTTGDPLWTNNTSNKR